MEWATPATTTTKSLGKEYNPVDSELESVFFSSLKKSKASHSSFLQEDSISKKILRCFVSLSCFFCRSCASIRAFFEGERVVAWLFSFRFSFLLRSLDPTPSLHGRHDGSSGCLRDATTPGCTNSSSTSSRTPCLGSTGSSIPRRRDSHGSARIATPTTFILVVIP
jgi:hypothetical protein